MDKEGFVDLVRVVGEAGAQAGGVKRCLVDLRQAESRITTLDRYDLAALAAEKLPAFKMATLVREKQAQNNLYENAANNRGLKSLVTDNETAALEWLLQ